MGNQVVLTFAGESRDLERAFSRVGKSSEEMSLKVRHSSEGFGEAGQNVSKFREGVEAAGKMAVPAAAASAALLGAAIAPALAAALAGGVVLALGGGVLIAGIVSAAKNPGVLKAFTGLKSQASKLFADFGKPFVGPLRTSVEFITSKLAGWAKFIDPLAQKFAPVITAFAHGLAGLVDNALPSIANAAGSSVPAFQAIAGFLPTIGTWIGVFVTKMAELFQWGIKNRDSIGKWISTLAPIVGIFLGIIGAIRIWIGVQTLLNIVMSLNPIGLIVIAVAALIAVIVVIATKTKFFQTVWQNSWKWIKNAASDTWDFIKKIPGWLGSAFSKIAGFITAPFRSAFNFVADAWNNTIGRLSWSVPGWVPGIGGDSISVPHLPHFHSGGVVGGTPGSEQLAVLQAGERISPAVSSGGDQPVVVQVTLDGDVLLEAIARRAQRRGGSPGVLGLRAA